MSSIELVPREEFGIALEPREVPGLVAFWNFSQSGTAFVASQGEPYCLQSRVGPLEVVQDPGASFGGRALRLREGQWLSIPRQECPKLDIHGQSGHLTLIAWLKRERTRARQCEFIAGQWNETNRGRQYGLFLNISVWGIEDRAFGHLSNTGGPTPGYRYCMDGCMGATPVPYDEWVVVAMSYDGQNGQVWFNGLPDVCPGVNPYGLAGGLHDSGPQGSDFTVGGVDRKGEMGNFFCGSLAALAFYNRALTLAEMVAIRRAVVK